MSHKPRKNRIAFRPQLDDGRLEERVVLNAAAAGAPWASYLQAGMGGPTGQSSQTSQLQSPNLAGRINRPGLGPLAQARQLNMLYRQQIRNTQQTLQQYARTQIANAYGNAANLGADGRLTLQARTSLQNNLNGALDAVAYQLSSQAALLPGATNGNLLSNIQDGLLGARRNSLSSRIATALNSGRFGRSQAMLQNVLDRQIAGSLMGNSMQLGNFLRSTPLANLSVDATSGQRIPISQFMSNQAAQQINNTLGTLANNIGPLAQSTLFDPTTGAFNSQAVGGFQQQFGNALNTAAFQAGNLLSLFPNSSSVRSQLGTAFFDNGVNATTGLPNTSFANSLAGVFPTSTGTNTSPFTSDVFNTGFQNGFTNAFQNFSTPLNNFFGIQPTTGTGTSMLPTGFFQSGATFPSVFGSQFGSNFNNGFNNGFLTNGSGLPGFGTAPTGFNNDFGTGFSNFITSTSGGLGPYPTSFLGGGTGTTGLGGTGTTGLGGSGTTGFGGSGTTGLSGTGIQGLGGTLPPGLGGSGTTF